MKISEILWKAANKCLSDDPWEDDRKTKAIYTCDAVELAVFGAIRGSYRTKTHALMRELGCNCGSMYQFEEYSCFEDAQQARYSWLMFASMIAEEWGL